jgi:hypothetical protein
VFARDAEFRVGLAHVLGGIEMAAGEARFDCGEQDD